MQNIGIFYGSSTGHTESAARLIQKEFGDDKAQTYDVVDASVKDLEQYPYIVLGCSTWGIGELQDDFEVFISELEAARLEGKKVAIYGYGDQASYPDSFVDAIGTIYESIKDKGCEVVGMVSTSGYDYDESIAEMDGGQFAGLPLDDENQSELSDERIKNWVENLKNTFV